MPTPGNPSESQFQIPTPVNAYTFDEAADPSSYNLNPGTPSLDPPDLLEFPLPDSLFSQSHADAPYTEYQIQSRFEWQSGTVATPVAGPPGTPQEIEQVHAPVCSRTVRWSATRVGSIPELPSPNTGSDNEVLASMVIVAEAPKPIRAGNFFIHRTSGVYTYHVLVALTPGVDPIPSSATPASTDSASGNNLRGYMFKSGVIAPTPSPGG